MTKVKPNNENETKSDIFPWGIFKSDVTSFFIKKYENISMTFKIKLSIDLINNRSYKKRDYNDERGISRNVASLNILVHGVINLL